MGLKEAKAYIKKLHKLQDNPDNWPDYLTGLPDGAAVMKKIDGIYDKLGKYAVSYVKISNINPYVIKYGTSSHAEIIQWAAAFLKTTASEYKETFVGAVGTHEFVVVSRTEDTGELIEKARNLFAGKIKRYYAKSDLEKKYILPFKNNKETVNIGFMDLSYSSINRPDDIEKHNIIPYLARLSRESEEGALRPVRKALKPEYARRARK